MLHFSTVANKIHCKIFHPEAISPPVDVSLFFVVFSHTVPSHFNSFRLFKTLLHLPELPLFFILASMNIAPNRAFCGLSGVSRQMKYHIQIMCHTHIQIRQLLPAKFSTQANALGVFVAVTESTRLLTMCSGILCDVTKLVAATASLFFLLKSKFSIQL